MDDEGKAVCRYISQPIVSREELGGLLRKLRTSKGITVRGMADLCNLSPATVQNIEKGSFSPRLDIVQKMLDTLGAKMTITTKEGDD